MSVADVEYLSKLPPCHPELVEAIVCQIKSQGLFDEFRKSCLADIDTRPAYLNLKQRVEGYVNKFLARQIWNSTMQKNQLRDNLRKEINESSLVMSGLDHLVDQLIYSKVERFIRPKVEKEIKDFLQLPDPPSPVHNDPGNPPPPGEGVVHTHPSTSHFGAQPSVSVPYHHNGTQQVPPMPPLPPVPPPPGITESSVPYNDPKPPEPPSPHNSDYSVDMSDSSLMGRQEVVDEELVGEEISNSSESILNQNLEDEGKESLLKNVNQKDKSPSPPPFEELSEGGSSVLGTPVEDEKSPESRRTTFTGLFCNKSSPQSTLLSAENSVDSRMVIDERTQESAIRPGNNTVEDMELETSRENSEDDDDEGSRKSDPPAPGTYSLTASKMSETLTSLPRSEDAQALCDDISQTKSSVICAASLPPLPPSEEIEKQLGISSVEETASPEVKSEVPLEENASLAQPPEAPPLPVQYLPPNPPPLPPDEPAFTNVYFLPVDHVRELMSHEDIKEEDLYFEDEFGRHRKHTVAQYLAARARERERYHSYRDHMHDDSRDRDRDHELDRSRDRRDRSRTRHSSSSRPGHADRQRRGSTSSSSSRHRDDRKRDIELKRFSGRDERYGRDEREREFDNSRSSWDQRFSHGASTANVSPLQDSFTASDLPSVSKSKELDVQSVSSIHSELSSVSDDLSAAEPGEVQELPFSPSPKRRPPSPPPLPSPEPRAVSPLPENLPVLEDTEKISDDEMDFDEDISQKSPMNDNASPSKSDNGDFKAAGSLERKDASNDGAVKSPDDEIDEEEQGSFIIPGKIEGAEDLSDDDQDLMSQEDSLNDKDMDTFEGSSLPDDIDSKSVHDMSAIPSNISSAKPGISELTERLITSSDPTAVTTPVSEDLSLDSDIKQASEKFDDKDEGEIVSDDEILEEHELKREEPHPVVSSTSSSVKHVARDVSPQASGITDVESLPSMRADGDASSLSSQSLPSAETVDRQIKSEEADQSKTPFKEEGEYLPDEELEDVNSPDDSLVDAESLEDATNVPDEIKDEKSQQGVEHPVRADEDQQSTETYSESVQDPQSHALKSEVNEGSVCSSDGSVKPDLVDLPNTDISKSDVEDNLRLEKESEDLKPGSITTKSEGYDNDEKLRSTIINSPESNIDKTDDSGLDENKTEVKSERVDEEEEVAGEISPQFETETKKEAETVARESQESTIVKEENSEIECEPSEEDAEFKHSECTLDDNSKSMETELKTEEGSVEDSEKKSSLDVITEGTSVDHEDNRLLAGVKTEDDTTPQDVVIPENQETKEQVAEQEVKDDPMCDTQDKEEERCDDVHAEPKECSPERADEQTTKESNEPEDNHSKQDANTENATSMSNYIQGNAGDDSMEESDLDDEFKLQIDDTVHSEASDGRRSQLLEEEAPAEVKPETMGENETQAAAEPLVSESLPVTSSSVESDGHKKRYEDFERSLPPKRRHRLAQREEWARTEPPVMPVIAVCTTPSETEDNQAAETGEDDDDEGQLVIAEAPKKRGRKKRSSSSEETPTPMKRPRTASSQESDSGEPSTKVPASPVKERGRKGRPGRKQSAVPVVQPATPIPPAETAARSTPPQDEVVQVSRFGRQRKINPKYMEDNEVTAMFSRKGRK